MRGVVTPVRLVGAQVLVGAEEVEHLHAGCERVGVAGEAVHADAEDEAVVAFERDLVEAGVDEPLRGCRR